ncbi:SH3 domain-containing protein [Mucilaginibacter sp. OK268]|uniref:SH3 domain-containing protein n=1 Tax=Mucilaginibacter sp. OK268 TaxID=1881048 RepID=UPI003518FDC8
MVNTEGTNFRSGPSTADAAIKKLSKGYEVGLISTSSDWSKVYLVNSQSEVLEKVNGKVKSIKTIGWVSSPLLTLKAGQ